MGMELEQFFLGLIKPKHPVVHEVHDAPFMRAIYKVNSDGTLGELVREAAPIAKPTLEVSTLTGFVDAYKAKLDGFDKAVVQVVDHKTVRLVALEGDAFGRRHEWLRAVCCEENPFVFGEFMQPEKFLINLHQGFAPTEEVIKLQRLASSLSAENSVATSDDGMSQVVTLKQGAVMRTTVELPTRLPLAPYRTFREVNPCFNDFMVRMKGVKDSLPTVALIEICGGKWKLDTVHEIGKWLRKHLPETATVIA